MRKKHNESF
jgi:cyclophilin family peptidyl-prolyl cis-trans isomerase